MIDWAIKGFEFGNCNCAPGCPCQFSQLPSDGTCEAIDVIRIDEGHYGDVRLGGLYCGFMVKWPGAVHEGNGQMQLFIDDKASDDQVAALEKIMTGQDTAEFATMFNVFSLMCPTKHETLRAGITMEYDADSGIGHAKIGDIAEVDVKPIPNIVSGDPHHVSIALRAGFEFSEAVMATGSTSLRNTAFDLDKVKNSHLHVAHLNLTGNGIVKAA